MEASIFRSQVLANPYPLNNVAKKHCPPQRLAEYISSMRRENSAANKTRYTTPHPAPYDDPKPPNLEIGNSDTRRHKRQNQRRASKESAAVPHMVIHGKKCCASIRRWYGRAEMILWKLTGFLDQHKLLPTVTPEEMLRREKRRSGKTKTSQAPESERGSCPTISTKHEMYISERHSPQARLSFPTCR
jgi:hypothetical protein